MACDLVHEERAGDAARLRQIRQRDVVIDDNHLNLDAEGAGALGGEAEIQTVAGVVLDDEKAARFARDSQDTGKNSIHRRRGEHLAADGCRQHALADEARMGRLVTGAAAGDQRHLRLVPVRTHDDLDVRKTVEPTELAARRTQETVDRLGDEVFLRIDELVHVALPIRRGLYPLTVRIEIERIAGLDF